MNNIYKYSKELFKKTIKEANMEEMKEFIKQGFKIYETNGYHYIEFILTGGASPHPHPAISQYRFNYGLFSYEVVVCKLS